MKAMQGPGPPCRPPASATAGARNDAGSSSECTLRSEPACDWGKIDEAELFQEVDGDGEGQHVELAKLPVEASDVEEKHATALF